MNKKLLGRWGEALAADYLRRRGYTLVGAGFSTRFGEIDLIVENKKFIVFVEVKLRKDSAVASAAEFVHTHKQRRIITAAKQWLADEDTVKQPRFDVVEIYAPNGADTAKPVINHIENAFWEET